MYYQSITQQRLDKQIMRIAERSDILRFLDPKNKFEECQKFIDSKGSYNPQFIYDDKHIPILNEATDYIQKLKSRAEKLRINNNLKQLMIAKCDEIASKFFLLQAYHKQDREKIVYYNEQLFGKLRNHQIGDRGFVGLEQKYHFDYKDLLCGIGLSDIIYLDRKQVKQLTEYHLQSIGRDRYQIKFGNYGNTNMQVSIGPKPVVYIHKKSQYKSIDVCISIMHEIYGHLLRYKQGINSGVHIFQGGTDHYLATEEGIAVFQSARIEGLEISGNRLIESYDHILTSEQCNRIQFSDYYISLGWKNLEAIFRSILRLKRGIEDTSIGGIGSTFYKDKVYADGYFDLLGYLEHGKTQQLDAFIFDEKLFMGRIKITDLMYT